MHLTEGSCQNNGTRVDDSENIFRAEFNAVFRFSLEQRVSEYPSYGVSMYVLRMIKGKFFDQLNTLKTARFQIKITREPDVQ